MTETVDMNKIYETLIALKQEVEFIKNHMVDADTILTADEHAAMDKSLQELDEGETCSIETIKNDKEHA